MGCGYSETRKLCYLLRLPKLPAPKAYQAHMKRINNVVTQLAEETMKEAASDIIRETGSNECAVSVDGSLQQ